ncbi:MAG: hypothetical protein ACRCZ2_10075 [Fusobacteriaceae bacterium]
MSNNLEYQLQLKTDSVNKTLSNLQKIIGNVKPVVELETTKIQSQISKLKVDLSSFSNQRIDLQIKTESTENSIKRIQNELTKLRSQTASPELDLKIEKAETKLRQFQNNLSKIKAGEAKIDIDEGLVKSKIAKLESDLQNAGQRGGQKLGKGISDGASSSLNGFGSRLNGIIDIALGNLAAQGFSKLLSSTNDFVSGSVDKFNEYKKAITTLEIVSPRFGINAQEAQKSAENLAKELRLGVGTTAESLQNLFKSGLNLDQASDLLKRFTNEAITGKSSTISLDQAVQNLAFGYNTQNSAIGNLSGISENFSDIQERGLKNLQSQGKLLGLTIGKLSEAEKAQAQYAGIIELTNLTLGSSEKFQGSFIDNQARLNQIIGETQRKFGERLDPFLNEVVKTLIPLVDGLGNSLLSIDFSFLLNGFKSISREAGNLYNPLFKGDFTGLFGLEEDSLITGVLFTINEEAQNLYNLLFKGDFTGLFGLFEDSPAVAVLLRLRDTAIFAFDTIKNGFNQFGNLSFDEVFNFDLSGIIEGISDIGLSALDLGDKLKNSINFDTIAKSFSNINFAGLVTNFSNLIDSVGDFFEALANNAVIAKIIDLIGQLATKLSELAGARISLLINQILPSLFDFFTKIFDYLSKNQSTLDAIILGITVLASAFVAFQAISGVIGIITTVVGVITSLGSIIGTVIGVIGSVGAIIGGIIATLNPISLIIAGIVAVVVGLYLAWSTNFLGIQDIVKNSINFIREQFNRFTNFLSEGVKSIVKFGTDLGTGISNGFNSIVTSITGFGTNLLNGFTTAFNAVLAFVTGFVNSVFSTITTVFTNILNFYTGIFNGFLSVATNVFKTVEIFIAAVFLTIVGLFSGNIQLINDAWGGFGNKLNEIWKSTVDSIIKFATDLWTSIGNTFNQISTNIGNTWNNLVKSLGDTWNSGVKNIIDFGNNLSKSIQDTFNNIVTGAINTWNNLTNYLSTTTQNVVNSVSNFFNQLPTNIANAVENAKNFAINGFNNIKDSVVNTAINLVNQVGNGFNDLKNKVSGGVENAINYLRNINLYDIGKNMIQGMVNGIADMAKNLTNTVKDTVNNAVNAAKNTLGIKSPSRVFMEIGNFTGEGFIVGLEKMSNSIQDSVSSTLDFESFTGGFDNFNGSSRDSSGLNRTTNNNSNQTNQTFNNQRSNTTNNYSTSYNGFTQSRFNTGYQY